MGFGNWNYPQYFVSAFLFIFCDRTVPWCTKSVLLDEVERRYKLHLKLLHKLWDECEMVQRVSSQSHQHSFSQHKPLTKRSLGAAKHTARAGLPARLLTHHHHSLRGPGQGPPLLLLTSMTSTRVRWDCAGAEEEQCSGQCGQCERRAAEQDWESSRHFTTLHPGPPQQECCLLLYTHCTTLTTTPPLPLLSQLSQQHHHCHYSHNSHNNTNNTATTADMLDLLPIPNINNLDRSCNLSSNKVLCLQIMEGN